MKKWPDVSICRTKSSLSKCRHHFLCQQFGVCVYIIGSAGRRQHDCPRAGVNIFLEPFLTFLGCASQRIFADQFGEILVVLLAELVAAHLSGLVPVCVYRSKDEDARNET